MKGGLRKKSLPWFRYEYFLELYNVTFDCIYISFASNKVQSRFLNELKTTSGSLVKRDRQLFQRLLVGTEKTLSLEVSTYQRNPDICFTTEQEVNQRVDLFSRMFWLINNDSQSSLITRISCNKKMYRYSCPLPVTYYLITYFRSSW